MQVLVVFFLATLVGCYGSRSECIDESQYCMARLPDWTMDDAIKRASCRELINSIECMDKAVTEGSCVDEYGDGLKEFIEEMKDEKNKKCNTEIGSYGEDSACKENAEMCVANIASNVLEGVWDFKACREMGDAILCLEEALEEFCAGDEDEDKAKRAVEKIKEKKNEKCSALNVPEAEDIKKCLEENEDYFSECIYKSYVVVLNALKDKRDAEDREDRIKCGLYMRTGECTVERVEEKCGVEAGKQAIAHVANIPDGVREACKTIGIILHAEDLGEDKKKK